MMTMSDMNFQPNWYSKPIESVLAMSKRKGFSPKCLAEILELSPNEMLGLKSGSLPITSDLACKISSTVGGNVDFWLKKQSIYQVSLSCAASKVPDGEAQEWLRQFPKSEIEENGWIHFEDESINKFEKYLAYFEVGSVDEWETKYADHVRSVKFRASTAFETKVGALTAWLRRAEIEAEMDQVGEWNPDALVERLSDLRKLTIMKSPSQFLPLLKEICAEAGISIAIVRAPSGCRASGATRIREDGSALVALSFRFLSNDHFWFTLFHELGHLLLHKESLTVVQNENDEIRDEETEANDFAARLLVPQDFFEDMLALPAKRTQIIRFARRLGVAPGILVGQMQHHGVLRRNQMNYLKRRFTWDELSVAFH